MKMNRYEEPILTVVLISDGDVITSSNGLDLPEIPIGSGAHEW